MVTCGLLGDADHGSVAQTERLIQVRVEYQVLNDRNDSSSSRCWKFGLDKSTLYY